MTEIYRNDAAAIAASIVQLYEDAKVDPDRSQSAITPLYRLIGAYNLRVEEISELNYQKAKHFLENETQTTANMEDSDRNLAGFLYVRRIQDNDYGCVLIHSGDPVVRRRFTAAHELGHYLLHFRRTFVHSSRENEILILSEGITYNTEINPLTSEDLPAGELQFTRDTHLNSLTNEELKRIEQEANQFAAQLLIPANKCHILFDRFSHHLSEKPSILIGRLASEFLVSREAMNWRLRNLGLITPTTSF